MADRAAVRVTVMYSPTPREVLEWAVTLKPGATVSQALQASGLDSALPDFHLRDARIGIWGRKAGLQQLVRDGDRIEMWRPLKVDPKLARRQRFQRQGSRGAGLFARDKPRQGPS